MGFRLVFESKVILEDTIGIWASGSWAYPRVWCPRVLSSRDLGLVAANDTQSTG